MPAYARPCESCCCIIYANGFAEASGDFSTVSGTWDIDFGSERLFTEDDNAVLKLNSVSAPSNRGNVSVTVNIDTAGGSARLIGSYTDSSNYLFCELVINGASSTFKLWSKLAGVDTQIGTTYTFTGAVNTDYQLRLCWDTSTFTGILGDVTAVRHGSVPAGTDDQVALGASANGGTVYFDNLLFKKSNIDDSSCPMCGGVPNCCANEIATDITVTFTFPVGGPITQTWTKTGMTLAPCPLSGPSQLLYGPNTGSNSMMGCSGSVFITGNANLVAGPHCDNDFIVEILSCWPFHAIGTGQASGFGLGAPWNQNFDVEMTE